MVSLRDTMNELLSMDEPRRPIAAMFSGLDIHHDLGAGHPLLGRRMPDLDLHTADGPTRVSTLLHDARPVLLNLGEPGGFDISPWANRARPQSSTGAADVIRCSANVCSTSVRSSSARRYPAPIDTGRTIRVAVPPCAST